MPAPSPSVSVSFRVELGGSVLPDTLEIAALRVEHAGSGSSSARITLLSGVAEVANLTASPLLAPGQAVRILAGYNDDNREIFSGLLSCLGVSSAPGDAGSAVALECTQPKPAPADRSTGPALTLTAGVDLIGFRLETAPVDSAPSGRRGQLRFAGSSAVSVGRTVEIAGLGSRFDGVTPVRSVLHEIHAGEWITTIEVGAASKAAMLRRKRDSAPAR